MFFCGVKELLLITSFSENSSKNRAIFKIRPLSKSDILAKKSLKKTNKKTTYFYKNNSRPFSSKIRPISLK